MLKLALDEEGKENDDLIGAVNGLCLGIGGTQKICGVLTGGIGIMGMYAGKRKETEYANVKFSKMVNEYIAWFEKEFESTDCSDIIGVSNFTDINNNQSFAVKCGDILIKNYAKIQEILNEYEYEFGNR